MRRGGGGGGDQDSCLLLLGEDILARKSVYLNEDPSPLILQSRGSYRKCEGYQLGARSRCCSPLSLSPGVLSRFCNVPPFELFHPNGLPKHRCIYCSLDSPAVCYASVTPHYHAMFSPISSAYRLSRLCHVPLTVSRGVEKHLRLVAT